MRKYTKSAWLPIWKGGRKKEGKPWKRIASDAASFSETDAWTFVCSRSRKAEYATETAYILEDSKRNCIGWTIEKEWVFQLKKYTRINQEADFVL